MEEKLLIEMGCLGLAADGVAGLVRALEILEEEVRICLGLLGATSFAELGPAHLAQAPAIGEPGVLGAFPLLGGEPPRAA
jgi:glycolate oxidase